MQKTQEALEHLQDTLQNAILETQDFAEAETTTELRIKLHQLLTRHIQIKMACKLLGVTQETALNTMLSGNEPLGDNRLEQEIEETDQILQNYYAYDDVRFNSNDRFLNWLTERADAIVQRYESILIEPFREENRLSSYAEVLAQKISAPYLESNASADRLNDNISESWYTARQNIDDNPESYDDYGYEGPVYPPHPEPIPKQSFENLYNRAEFRDLNNLDNLVSLCLGGNSVRSILLSDVKDDATTYGRGLTKSEHNAFYNKVQITEALEDILSAKVKADILQRLEKYITTIIMLMNFRNHHLAITSDSVRDSFITMGNTLARRAFMNDPFLILLYRECSEILHKINSQIILQETLAPQQSPHP